MRAGAWLAGREPAAPPALARRLADIIAATRVDDADLATGLVRAGEATVRELLRDGCTTRDSALALLAADALVTYACEAAAESPAGLGAWAASAMARIARIPVGTDA